MIILAWNGNLFVINLKSTPNRWKILQDTSSMYFVCLKEHARCNKILCMISSRTRVPSSYWKINHHVVCIVSCMRFEEIFHPSMKLIVGLYINFFVAKNLMYSTVIEIRPSYKNIYFSVQGKMCRKHSHNWTIDWIYHCLKFLDFVMIEIF